MSTEQAAPKPCPKCGQPMSYAFLDFEKGKGENGPYWLCRDAMCWHMQKAWIPWVDEKDEKGEPDGE